MPNLIGCPDCGAIQEMPPISSGRLLCWRCHCPLERATGRAPGTAFACALTTLILLVPANLMLLMSVSKQGLSAQMHLASGIATIWHQEWPIVAVVVALEAVALPFLRFGLLAASLGAVLVGHSAAWVGPTFRRAEALDLWAMPDVFLIGCAIGYSRLAPFAGVTIGAGGWCFVGAALMAMLTRATLQRRRVWRRIMTPAAVTGDHPFSCNACDMVVPAHSEGESCPRCGQTLWRRRRNAMPFAMAFTLAGLLLYPVANLFPLSVLDWAAGTSPHTLFSAVERLIGANLWFLAGCVFTTSIAIPFIKLIGMLWFYLSVRRRSTRHLVFKTRFYRTIDELGRWSTMDIFTVAVYMPLIQFGQLATVRIGAGLPALLAVVVLTMLASRCFDPRLLWDVAEANSADVFSAEPVAAT
ncbi:paraquat-inducible protein A [Rhodopila sp.]|uniref:paraquat-inducible protein A n=1 Tax=Rhodopila sp. TaxID=2480087 RepID=UPI003D10B6F8